MTMEKVMRLCTIMMIAVLVLNLKAGAQNVGINAAGNSADASAGLDVDFTDKGMLIPRMTTLQRNNISSPAEGLQIFNTTTKCFEAYVLSAWYAISCPQTCLPPEEPTEGTHTPTSTQIVWNWNAAVNAMGYKFNTVNDYSTATDNGASLTYTQSGLTCATVNNLYVWAYNACGNSASITLTETTTNCFTGCIETVSTGLVEVTSPTTGKIWMDRNLGASQVAANATDANSFGCLFQWGRLADGHEDRGSTTTTTLSSTDTPGHGNYITTSSTPHDWRSPQNDNLWQGVNGTNNPCPAGYKLPTYTEMENERVDFINTGGNNTTGAFGSFLKMPICSFRNTNGSITNFTQGRYWTSTISTTDGTKVRTLQNQTSNSAISTTGLRSRGNAIRCIKN